MFKKKKVKAAEKPAESVELIQIGQGLPVTQGTGVAVPSSLLKTVELAGDYLSLL